VSEASIRDAARSDVLVVSNQLDGVREVESALRKFGASTAFASSTADALNLLRMRDFAVLIVDARSPEALAGAPSLLKARAHAPALVLTGTKPERTLAGKSELSFATFIPLKDLAHQLMGLIDAFREIHAEKREASELVVETLKGREVDLQARYRLLAAEASEYALIYTDLDGRISEWPDAAQKLFGYSEKEALGQNLSIIFSEEDQRRRIPQREIQNALAKGQAPDNRYLRRKDGSIFYTLGRIVLLRDADGNPRGLVKVLRDTSAIKRLQEHEANFREIFHNANEGIWILDSNAHVQLVNSRMAEILGYTVEDIMGRHELDFVFPEDSADVARLFAERSAGTSASVDVRFRHKTGRPIWTHMAARPLFREGKFAGALDMFSDVTPRREAEEKLHAFFELSATGNAILDPATGQFIDVNDRFCAITGRSREELLRSTFRDITHPKDREADECRLDELKLGHVGEIVAEKRYVHPDGSVVWVRLTTTIVRDSKGGNRYQLSVVQDITKSKSAELQLQASREQLKLATEAARLGIFCFNFTTGEVSWNEQLRTLLALPLDTAPSVEKYLSHVHPDDVSQMREAMSRVATGPHAERNSDTEHRVVLADGSIRYIASHAAQMLQTSPEGVPEIIMVGALRDVTTERAFEAELRRKVEARTAELVERTGQLQALLYSVAHDLRAPLRAMNAYAQILREEGGSSAPGTTEYLDRIQAAARRMDRLTTDLLDFSRLGQMHVELESMPLREAVDTALQELEHELKQRKANVLVPPELPSVRASRFLLERCLVNLVSNANRFCPPERTPQISVSAEPQGNRVRIFVRDNGVGIHEKHRTRIFGLFEKLHSAEDYPGTGIGLAIVDAAVKRMNGIYGVESKPGEGSVFWIELDGA
jgi:PAS domain S-box-containing protein